MKKLRRRTQAVHVAIVVLVIIQLAICAIALSRRLGCEQHGGVWVVDFYTARCTEPVSP